MSDISNDVHATFAQILKSPQTYVLVIVVNILLFFVMKFGGATDQINKNCELEKQELRKELVEERKEKGVLVNALLVKSGVIDAFVRAADSLDVSIGEQTKDIVLKNQK